MSFLSPTMTHMTTNSKCSSLYQQWLTWVTVEASKLTVHHCNWTTSTNNWTTAAASCRENIIRNSKHTSTWLVIIWTLITISFSLHLYFKALKLHGTPCIDTTCVYRPRMNTFSLTSQSTALVLFKHQLGMEALDTTELKQTRSMALDPRQPGWETFTIHTPISYQPLITNSSIHFDLCRLISDTTRCTTRL